MGQEGSDHDSKITRFERRWKRSSLANRVFEKKKPNSKALTLIQNNQDKAMLDLVEEYNNNEDPQYNMFLNNVRQYGESYALVVSQSHDVPELLRYEIVDLVDDECEVGIPEPDAIESYPVKQNTKVERILRRLSSWENREIATSLADFSGDGDVLSARTLRYLARNNRKKEISGTSDDGPSKSRKICSAGRNLGRESSIWSGSQDNYLIEYESALVDAVDDVPSDVWSTRRSRYHAMSNRKREISETTDDVLSKRGKLHSVGRNAGGESSIRYALEDDCLIEYENAHEGDVDDVPSGDWGARTLRHHARNNRKKEILGTSDDGPSNRRTICSAGRDVGRESSIRSGWQDNYLIEYETAHEDAVDDVPSGVCSARTLRCLARSNRKRAISETTDDGPSKRRTMCSVERNGGVESSKPSGLEDNYLIEYESVQEGDVNDILSGERKSCLMQRRAGKQNQDRIAGEMCLRSGTESEQLVENEFNHDDDFDEDYMRFLNSGYVGANEELGLEGNLSDQCISDHEDDFNEDYMRYLNSTYGGANDELSLEGNLLDLSDHEDEIGEEFVKYPNSSSRGTSGGSHIRPLSEGLCSDQHQSDHEDESCDLEENDFTSPFELKSDHENEIDDLDKYCRLVNAVRGGTNRQSNTRPRLRGSHSVECECDREDFSDDIDQNYMTFLGLLGKDGVATAMYNIDDGPERSDEVEEIESDVEITVMDKDPYSGATTPFVSSKQCIDVENYSLDEDPSISCSQFKKGLMKVLEMPYDSKEHEYLKDEVSLRKPILQVRVMRHSTKSYPVEDKLGKSYLDLYSDFAKQLDQAKHDNCKSLNLLRGFFYWLKNITLDKAFKPWLDPSCLELLPQ